MNIHKNDCQERIQENHGLVKDFSFEHAARFSQQFGAQKRPHQMMGILEGRSQQQSFSPATSSSTIVSRIGSPGFAFSATERYMGFPQYDYQHGNNPNLCPEISKNYEAQIQQSGDDNFYGIESSQQASPNFGRVWSNQCNGASSEISYSERERILQLKRKLLGDFDPPENKRQVPIPFDGNGDLRVSHNSYADHLANLKESARISSNAAATSGSSVMSNKTRIRWSQDLHDRFVECVNRLGGAEKATPKAILKLMDSEGLTIYHVKSHLQKYRIAKYMPDSAKGKSENRSSINDLEQIDIQTGMQLKEALQLQLDVQRRLHEQLEIQRNLQLRIEEQGKQLKLMFDQQQKTNITSVVEIQTPNDKNINDLCGTGLEQVQVLIEQGSENSQCPSKIS